MEIYVSTRESKSIINYNWIPIYYVSFSCFVFTCFDFVFSSQNLKFKDFDNDGIISKGEWTLQDHGDFKVIGNTTPRYQYSITLNASYAGFDINAFFRGVGQRDVYPDKESAAFWGPYSRKYMVMPKFVGENIWTEDNPNAYFPRPQAYISTGSQDL